MAAARWVEDSQCLKLFLPSPEAQKELQNNSSLLLRFFQNSESALASIVKLSILNEDRRETDVPEAVPQAESVSQSPSDAVLEPNDYAKLPREIQILQKVLRAQVRERKITDNDKAE